MTDQTKIEKEVVHDIPVKDMSSEAAKIIVNNEVDSGFNGEYDGENDPLEEDPEE